LKSGTNISSPTLEVRLRDERASSLRSPSFESVLPLRLELRRLSKVSFTPPGTYSVTFLLSTNCPLATPSAPYPFRLGLVPRTKGSSDKLDANVPEATRGDGSGVRVLEGRCNVDPLGVMTGEEVCDPF
jgi:hypothetical protein